MTGATKIPYVRKTRDGFEVRIPVPPQDQARLGKKNLTKRLGTASRSVAMSKAPAIVASLLATLRTPVAVQPPLPTGGFDAVQALEAIDDWAAAARQRVLPVAFSLSSDDPCPLGIEWKEQWLRTGDAFVPAPLPHDPGDTLLRDVLAAAQIAMPDAIAPIKRLRRAFYKACIDLKVEIARVQAGQPEPLMDLRAPTGRSRSPTTGPTILDVFQQWKARHIREGKSEKTCDEFEAQVRRFTSLHGDLPVKDITRKHCRSFRDLMQDYPSRLSTAQKKLAVQAVVEAARSGSTYKRLDAKTLNCKVFAAVGAILNFAVAEDFIDTNPMTGIRVRTTDTGEAKKLPYTLDDMRAIFHSPVMAGREAPKKRGRGVTAQWLPLIAAFTGARLEEIAQLAVSDFKREDDIPYIHFRTMYDEDEKARFKRSLKNKASYRKVPIHSKLLDLGLLDYVGDQRTAGISVLFPGLLWDEAKKNRADLKVSRSWGGWYNPYSRDFVSDTKKSFHSFRHTVKQRLRNAGVDKSLRDAIQGHAAEDVADVYGRDEEGSGFDLKTLKAAVELLTYPGVVFTMPKATSIEKRSPTGRKRRSSR